MTIPSQYGDFISRKLATDAPTGIARDVALPESLFPMQQDLVRWALRRGRAAIFADTGLGKTRMQLAWADAVHRETGHDVLILAPLAVARQTAGEGAEIGVHVTYCRDGADVQPGINITNYDRLHRFDPSLFGAVVLDESSCIKHHDTRTLATLLEAFSETPFRLCATATPAPNDWTELGTHAEFLGVCSRVEMLSEYFVHDGGETQTWRLKGHARGAFWAWVASWGAVVRSPADLGYDASMYELPELIETEHLVGSDESGLTQEGMLFALEARSLSERRAARKASLDERVAACAAVVNADDQPWIIWGDLNAETQAITKAIPGAVEIAGPDSAESKEQRLADFAAGRIRVLVTKGSIAGWGLNWQHCARVAFVGLSDSFEAWVKMHCDYEDMTPREIAYMREAWQAARAQLTEGDDGQLEDLRARGYTVAVHNDYRLNGAPHTFWLFTGPDGMSYKGEGQTDADALRQVREAITARALAASQPEQEVQP